MAYLRWGGDSDWYVFWVDTRAVAKAELEGQVDEAAVAASRAMLGLAA